MTEHIILSTRLRNHPITQNEEEFHEENRMVEETLLGEEAEEEYVGLLRGGVNQ